MSLQSQIDYAVEQERRRICCLIEENRTLPICDIITKINARASGEKCLVCMQDSCICDRLKKETLQ